MNGRSAPGRLVRGSSVLRTDVRWIVAARSGLARPRCWSFTGALGRLRQIYRDEAVPVDGVRRASAPGADRARSVSTTLQEALHRRLAVVGQRRDRRRLVDA